MAKQSIHENDFDPALSLAYLFRKVIWCHIFQEVKKFLIGFVSVLFYPVDSYVQYSRCLKSADSDACWFLIFGFVGAVSFLSAIGQFLISRSLINLTGLLSISFYIVCGILNLLLNFIRKPAK